MRPHRYTEAELVPDLPVPSIGHNSLHTDDVSDWPPKAIRALADEQERRILLECEMAAERERRRATNPVAEKQFSSVSR